MGDGFEHKDLSRFSADLMELAQKDFPKETKRFMGQCGTKVKKKAVDITKSKLKTRSGKLIAGFQRGKPYQYGDDYQVRVKNTAFHANPKEHGHHLKYVEVTVKRGKHQGEKRKIKADPSIKYEGTHAMTKAQEEYESEFYKDAQRYVDRMLKRGKL